jgi:hypothetical protein
MPAYHLRMRGANPSGPLAYRRDPHMGKAPTIGTCRLCKRSATLCDSHILPEFLYETAYDSKHRLLSVPAGKNSRFVQKGLRERLLCQRCETHLSVLENYGKSVLDTVALSPMPTARGPTVIPNVDYDKFKLFLMSLLWRSGVAYGAMWDEVNLGAHEEVLRDMLLNNAPGQAHKYGCIIVRSPDLPPQLRRALVAPVSERSAGGHRSYRFLFAAMSWRFYVSSHTEQLTKYAAYQVGPFISSSGDLPIHPDFDGMLSAWSKQIMKRIRDHRRRYG